MEQLVLIDLLRIGLVIVMLWLPLLTPCLTVPMVLKRLLMLFLTLQLHILHFQVCAWLVGHLVHKHGKTILMKGGN